MNNNCVIPRIIADMMIIDVKMFIDIVNRDIDTYLENNTNNDIVNRYKLLCNDIDQSNKKIYEINEDIKSYKIKISKLEKKLKNLSEVYLMDNSIRNIIIPREIITKDKIESNKRMIEVLEKYINYEINANKKLTETQIELEKIIEPYITMNKTIKRMEMYILELSEK